MSVPIIVINFGHSVLRSLDDYTNAASEIYRHYRQGKNVVAVTSAQGDQTDVLMAEARRVGPESTAENLPELIQLGERRSAALLALALERIGAPAFVRQARDLGLMARGENTQAELVDLKVDQIREDLQNHDIVVMPGFVGIGENDRPSLLGDGGADLTALFVAQKLGVPALLLKDVDGVYEADPKKGGEPLRYSQISFDDARRRASVLISPKALDFAQSHQFAFDIGRPGFPFYTQIGPVTTKPAPRQTTRPLRVVMMGLGVVGGGVYRRIKAMPDHFDLVRTMVRTPQKYISEGYNASEVTTEFGDLLDAQADIFIDVSGPVEPALGFTRDMLSRGVNVVSANKQAIATGGQALLDFADSHGANLAFSSAAGGGMPILEMCRREAGHIKHVDALLNGTTNYMLDAISAGRSYDDALRDAQNKGFAEADPSSDVSGLDAAAKLRLVALLGFGREVKLDDIPRETIEGFAMPDSYNGVFKRVGSVWGDRDKAQAALSLKELPEADFLAKAKGEQARAIFYFSDGRVYKIRGKGAGRWPTTEAVMADLYDIFSKAAFAPPGS